jgi:hypothetical protein
MADSKISALPASTTPLAGTEVLPIVQSSATKQVSVANLTAGRAISATQLTLTTGNLIVANGQGIDFSATSGAGTSELLADYEEGTYTPTVTASFGTLTTVIATGNYTKIGRQVTVNVSVTLTNAGLASGALIATLPFTAGLFPSIGIGREDQNTGTTLQIRLDSAVPSSMFILTITNTTIIATGNVVFATITYFV